MIVGNGLIANLFKDCDTDDVIFFASGVSNSSETDVYQFKREEKLIRDTFKEFPDRIFIYFSTCSIYDSSKNNSPYVLHKLRMEELVKDNVHKYLILRVSNAVGKGGNPNLLINYLINCIMNDHIINVHTLATRNLIDSEDIRNLTLQLIYDTNYYNKITNIAYPQGYTIIEILEILERFFDKRPKVNLIKSGSGYDINVQEIEDYFKKNTLMDKESYLCKILEKYFS